MALNERGVRPVTDNGEMACAVMVVVHPADPEKGNPIGGALNWEKKLEVWKVTDQVEEAKPYRGDN